MMLKTISAMSAGGAVAFGMAMVGAAPAAAQDDWPQRSVTLVIPYAAGGGADFVARLIANGIEEELGESVVVESRPGASGVIGAQFVAQSEADGYTVMLSPAAPLVNAPLLNDNVPYDPQADLEPLMKLVVSPIMVLVSGDVEAENLEELVALARENPGEIAIGNSGAGSTQQLLSLMFQGGTDTELNLVSYTGSGEIVPDLLAGRLDMMIDFPSPYSGYFESGDVRVLATLNDERLDLFPDVPTVAEAGFPEVPAWSGWFGLFGPDGIPQEVQDKLTSAISTYLESEEAQERLATAGYSVDVGSAEELEALMSREREILTGLVDEYGLGQN